MRRDNRMQALPMWRSGHPVSEHGNRKLEVVVVVVVLVVVLVLARPETEAELRRYWIDVKGIKDKGQPASTASPNNSGLYFEMDAAAG